MTGSWKTIFLLKVTFCQVPCGRVAGIVVGMGEPHSVEARCGGLCSAPKPFGPGTQDQMDVWMYGRMDGLLEMDGYNVARARWESFFFDGAGHTVLVVARAYGNRWCRWGFPTWGFPAVGFVGNVQACGVGPLFFSMATGSWGFQNPVGCRNWLSAHGKGLLQILFLDKHHLFGSLWHELPVGGKPVNPPSPLLSPSRPLGVRLYFGEDSAPSLRQQKWTSVKYRALEA